MKTTNTERLKNDLITNHWMWNYTWRGANKLETIEKMYGVPRADILAIMRDIAHKHDPPNADKMPKTRCDSCGMRILWGKMNNKPHPLDPKTLNIITLDNRLERGRESHFVSCPNAKEHRRK